ncbi:hypothetical protein [Halalkalibacter krulwichiae]|uniref:hypothetical protein n=1 Tax=Halalkalibacter krulwichiae TaxID=199441 RepID=UPI000826C54D|nr:hypothetical protein [Halalkalibacter krulwichiae]
MSNGLGQGLVTIGATKQLTTKDSLTLSAQKLEIGGNLLQSLGSAIQAIGGEEALIEELVTGMQEFIP